MLVIILIRDFIASDCASQQGCRTTTDRDVEQPAPFIDHLDTEQLHNNLRDNFQANARQNQPAGASYTQALCSTSTESTTLIMTLDVIIAARFYLGHDRFFKCPFTESLAKGHRVRRFDIERIALRKIRQLQVLEKLEDLGVPPGNRLEALKGHRKGQYSIRINDQFRICFRWTKAGASDVVIVDYH